MLCRYFEMEMEKLRKNKMPQYINNPTLIIIWEAIEMFLIVLI